MAINTNKWNRIRYTFYTPGYDLLGGYFRKSRQESIQALDLKPGEKVLIVGAGTGLDLEFIPKDCHIVACDITPSMIEALKKRSEQLHLPVQAYIMDGQKLDFPDQTFDKIILHLILAVIPDPFACISESERVLKENGKIAVFDKFVAEGSKISKLRFITNIFTNVIASDITRYFEEIVSHTRLNTLSNKAADFNGLFRLILLNKPNTEKAEQ